MTLAFGESTVSRARGSMVVNRFKEGREDVKDEQVGNQWKHWRSEDNVFEQSSNHYYIIEVADDVGISFGSCQARLFQKCYADLGMPLQLKPNYHNESAGEEPRPNKRKIKTGAVDDTKKRVSEVFWGFEKHLHKGILSEVGYFLKKFRITVFFDHTSYFKSKENSRLTL